MTKYCRRHMHTYGRDCPICMMEEVQNFPSTTQEDRKIIYQQMLAVYECGYFEGFCKLIHRINDHITLNDFPELCALAPHHIEVMVMESEVPYDYVWWFPYDEKSTKLRMEILRQAIAVCTQ